MNEWAVAYMKRRPPAVMPWIRHLERIGAIGALAELTTGIFDESNSVELVRAALERACERNPRDAFDPAVLRALGESVRPFLERHANLAVRCSPSLLFDKRGFEGKKAREEIFAYALGERRSEQMTIENRHAIASDRSVVLSPAWNGSEPARKLREFAPRLFVFHGLPLENPRKFYDALLDRLSTHVFFPIYQATLRESISAEDMSSIDNVRLYAVPDAVWRQAMDVVFLGESVSAVRYKDFIFGLPPDDRSALLDALVTLVRYGQGTAVFDLSTAEGRRDAFARARQCLSEASGVELPPGIERLPMNTVHAQLTYYRKTARRYPDLARAFLEYLSMVASDSFVNWRNWGEADVEPGSGRTRAALDRMKSSGLIPEGTTLEQYEAWVRPDHLDMREELSFSANDVTSGVRDILSQAVADAHLSSETAGIQPNQIERELEQISAPLRGWMARAQELDSRFARARVDRRVGRTDSEPSEAEKEEHASLKVRVQSYRSENDRRIRFLTGLRCLERMKHLTSDELQTRMLEIEKKRVPWDRAFKDIVDGVVAEEPAFATDAARLRRLLDEAHQGLFGGARVSRRALTMDDVIDPVALFHVGEKPVPSCQHWDGDGAFNRGLLSYQIDSNVRMIFMRDEEGRLVSRAALRLLRRDDGSPALFIERVYSSNAHPKIKEMSLRFAQRKARTMDVPLYTSRGEQVVEGLDTHADSVTLESRGSRAGFVYTDAGGGRAPNGRYVIEGAVRLPGPTV